MSAEPLHSEVLDLLAQTTGISSPEAWRNIWLLISKSEHDNQDPERAFLRDDGGNVFSYAAALDYDCTERGVTMGLVGWTTGCDGKDGGGDAPALFKVYQELGGEDLMPYCDGCCGYMDKCESLIQKIKSLEGDPLWVKAQWQQLVTEADDGAYLFRTLKAWRKIGVENPSALAIATVFDASLNQGCGGEDGGCSNLKRLGVHGDENATLEAYNAWRRQVAGTNSYNDPPCNGENRADQFEKLRLGGHFSLTGEAASQAVREAISWTMM